MKRVGIWPCSWTSESVTMCNSMLGINTQHKEAPYADTYSRVSYIPIVDNNSMLIVDWKRFDWLTQN